MAPQPYFNKYKIIDKEASSAQEVITYPTVNGDVNVNKKHNAYVDALSGKRGWGEGDYIS